MDSIPHLLTTLPHLLRHLFIRHAKLVDERLVRKPLFNGAQVLSLHILHKRHLKLELIRRAPDHGGDGLQTKLPRRAQSPLPPPPLIGPLRLFRHYDRLQNAILLDGCFELLHLLLRERLPWLKWIDGNGINGEFRIPLTGRSRKDLRLQTPFLWNEGIQSLTKSRHMIRPSEVDVEILEGETLSRAAHTLSLLWTWDRSQESSCRPRALPRVEPYEESRSEKCCWGNVCRVPPAHRARGSCGYHTW